MYTLNSLSGIAGAIDLCWEGSQCLRFHYQMLTLNGQARPQVCCPLGGLWIENLSQSGTMASAKPLMPPNFVFLADLADYWLVKTLPYLKWNQKWTRNMLI